MKISEYNGSDETRSYSSHWVRCAILALITSLPTISLAQAIGFQMEALDPNPVATYAPFAIVLSLHNPRTTAVTVNVKTNADDTTNSLWNHGVFALKPGESRIAEMGGTYSTAGNKVLKATATEQNGAAIGTRSRGIRVFPASSPPLTPRLFNPGPDQSDLGGLTDRPTSSGVVSSIVGTDALLFAIPKTGGVWRSISGGTWLPLTKSPPRAYSIAITNGGKHIAVGEREDDVSDSRLGRSGVWESLDSGDTWTYTFDPATVSSKQSVPAVAFSMQTSTLFIATASGVYRRPTTASSKSLFDGPFTPGYRKMVDTDCHATNSTTPLGLVTSVLTSESRVWARSTSELFYSDDDGKSWDCWPFPATVDLPGQPMMNADFNNYSSTNITDNANLAAFDDEAFVIFKASGSTSSLANSATPLLIFYPGTKTSLAQFTLDGDGRGLFGHRFVKAYSVDASECRSSASRTIGDGRQVFVGTAQSVEQATSVDAAGRLVWDRFVGTDADWGSAFTLDVNGKIVDSHCCPISCAHSTLPLCPDWNVSMHADMWEFALPDDFCPASRSYAYTGTDGGVYKGTGTLNNSKISAMSWNLSSTDLHVQTAQDLGFTELPPIPASKYLSYRMGYPTQDNDSPWRYEDGSWVFGRNQGDSNFIAADVGFPEAITWRGFANGDNTSYATYFGSVGSSPIPFSFDRDTNGAIQKFSGSAVIQAIQTLTTDPTPSSLDIVWLAQLPLPDVNGSPIPDPPGGTQTGPRTVLMRNKNFSSSYAGPAVKFKNWSIVNDDIPAGAARLWTSGGHQNPRYFLYTDSTNTSCPSGLTRWTINRLLRTSSWECLIKNLLDDHLTDTVARLQGPAFVDPFDPNKIVAAVRGEGVSNSIQMTLDAVHFCTLPILEALITESGRYNLVGSYDPDGTFQDVSSRFHGDPLAVPSHISFNRHVPTSLLVASPFTGLYLGTVSMSTTNAGQCVESWQDLTPSLPTSRAYITGTGFVGDIALITARRSLVPMRSTTDRPLSLRVIFDTQPSAPAGGQVATLRDGKGAAIAGGIGSSFRTQYFVPKSRTARRTVGSI